MRKSFVALSAAALLGAATAAPAAVINFSYALSDGIGLAGAEGTGSFETSVDDGTFGLGDVTAFSMTGTGFLVITQTDYSFDLSNLLDVNGALSGGALTDLSFSVSGPAIWDFGFPFEGNFEFTVTGLGAGNVEGSLTSFGTQDLAGDLTASVSGAPGSVPEPASWALMIVGFGVAGAALRGRRGHGAALAA
ncbi:PEPxxWA-CTERM sorting domain-containing protein [Sphingomonas quercus]|uniref:PEPxxWA-CTERM sorting domain-containing protein n=1 Tax=Sphingomonas quercus TaxID=2842451 RepID=A0ABS6BM95_9SPHN|nr:PEPxxWA-CTERM sorting domain-containing protein [Sphingomonas quercus]MBU3078325.1 PEPxxWA-CTERM sorting domain-containing protein [Sphingomonas quercus]